jgi:hypothetical protein
MDDHPHRVRRQAPLSSVFRYASTPGVMSDLGRRLLALIGLWALQQGASLLAAGSQPDIWGEPTWALVYVAGGCLAIAYAVYPRSLRLYEAVVATIMVAPVGRCVGLVLGGLLYGPASGWWRISYAVGAYLMLALLLRLVLRRMAPRLQVAGHVGSG